MMTELMTIDEVVPHIGGLSRDWLLKQCRAGTFPGAVKLSGTIRCRYAITREGLDSWLRSRQQAADDLTARSVRHRGPVTAVAGTRLARVLSQQEL